MFRRVASLVAALTILGVALAAAPAVLAGGGCPGEGSLPRTDEAAIEIKAAPCAFAPTVARVPVGATVTFFNADVTHYVTGANAEWGSRERELKPGQTVSYRFDKPGIYPYACSLHPGMSGAIVVGDVSAAAGPAAAGGATGEATGGATGGAESATSSAPSGVGAVAPIVAGGGLALALAGAAVLLARRRRSVAL